MKGRGAGERGEKEGLQGEGSASMAIGWRQKIEKNTEKTYFKKANDRTMLGATHIDIKVNA